MKKKIGEYLVDKELLTATERDQVLAYSRSSGLRFGQASVALGVLSRDQLVGLFGSKYQFDYFHLDPTYFPTSTQSLLPAPMILRYGVVALGFKSRMGIFGLGGSVLNIGLLSPDKKEAIEAVKEHTGQRSVRSYLVLAGQLVPVLERVYGLDPDQIRIKAQEMPGAVDETLSLYLEL